jgi:hypothetical protein
VRCLVVVALALVSLVFAPGLAQQTGLTDAQTEVR